ncbi:MAG: aldo/keto reductase [Malacoplasma sp.]|nr:aldo/keto reductase [Malacoplasma sp.]
MTIGYGTFQVKDKKILKECIKAAVNNGYDYIDTAYIYGNEKAIGDAIKLLRKEGFDKKIVIQTKVWPTQFSNVKKAIKESCNKLGVEKLDMCLLHRPHFDLNLSISAWKQMIKCKEQGLVDKIGLSNFDKDMVEIIYLKTKTYPEMHQIELSVNSYREDRVAYNNEKNIEIQAWSPMGDLENNLENPLLKKMSKKYDTDVASILISFVASQGNGVIIKTQNPERVINNKKAYRLKLKKEDIEDLKKLNTYKNKFSETFIW